MSQLDTPARGIDKLHPLQNIRWEDTFSSLYLVANAEFDGEQEYVNCQKRAKKFVSLIKPETVLKWQRNLIRKFWTLRSDKPRIGSLLFLHRPKN